MGCIVTDCQTVSKILGNITADVESGRESHWPDDDGCNDYWETIDEILRQKLARIQVKWMPSHLDEEGKAEQRRAFLSQGGCQEWIEGNCGADEMAKKGAALAAPPGNLLAGKNSHAPSRQR